ncbi:hypothetical protein MY535_06140 [Haemophilus influenzae]|nr:hypothetical protein [Haemophilus influenzae]
MARVLEDLGYVRQLNEGVSRIYESMENHYWQSLNIENKTTMFI